MIVYAVVFSQVDVDKPLGLSLAQSNAEGGGILVKSVSGNAAKAGIKAGDTIIYTSSFFGDELWPAGNKRCTRSTVIERTQQGRPLVCSSDAQHYIVHARMLYCFARRHALLCLPS
jgi:hypothetical protein